MSIPASGPISMSMFNTELGRINSLPNTRLAGGEIPENGTIFYLASVSSSTPVNQIAPHKMSEFYSYTANLTTLVYTIELQTAAGGGVCVGTGTFSNAEFTSNLPSIGTSFTDDGGATVYKRTNSPGFLNSGSDVSFGTVTTGVQCNL